MGGRSILGALAAVALLAGSSAGRLAAQAIDGEIGTAGSGSVPASGEAADTAGPALRSLGLDEALEEARRGNPDLREARLAGEGARATARLAGSALLPGIELDVGLQRSNDPVFAFGTKLRQQRFGAADLALDALNHPSPLNNWSTGVSVRWNVLDPTAWARRAAAGHGATAAGFQTERAEQGAELQTRVLYWRAVGAEASVRAATSAEAAARATVERFRKREEKGLLTHADVLRAEAELASARAGRVEAERGRDDARSALGLALGWSPDTLPVPSDTLAAPEGAVPATGSFDPASRADLRARAEVVRADRAKQNAAVAAFLPSVEAFAGYQRYADAPFGGDGDAWSAGVMLRWTLFAGLSRPAALDRARAERETAELRYARAERDARAEVSSARRAVDAARREVEATRAAETAATEARDLMRRRFEEGLMGATDLLAAEARASAARSGAVGALAGYHEALARLRFALGRTTGEGQP